LTQSGRKVIDSEGFGLIFRKTARDTNGELLEMEAFYRPHGKMPPAHIHPEQEEYFQVMSGTFRVQLEDETREYHTGETFTVPVGARHAMHNVSAEKGQLLWQTRPALNSEGFFATLWSMEQSSPTGKRGFAQLIRLAVIFNEYKREVRLANKVQRTVLLVLSVAARIGGITASSMLPKDVAARIAD
jgi:quercetin dioxygenase-like cupin family protein